MRLLKVVVLLLPLLGMSGGVALAAQNFARDLARVCPAAEHGDPQASYELGWMYLNGYGVPHDDATAVMWLHKAATHGVPQATNLLRLLANVRPSRPHGCSVFRGTLQPAAAPPAIRAVVEKTAQAAGLPAPLVLSVISVESAFNSNAVSPRKAMGLMQLMPGTAERFGVRDPFDYRENVRGGVTYLRWLLDKFNGNVTLALAGYNAGENAVVSHGGVPPYRETREYVARVKQLCGCGDNKDGRF